MPPLSYLVTTPGGARLLRRGHLHHREPSALRPLDKPDVAVLGVGGVESHGQSFTELYPEEAALVAKWLGVRVAFPIHYRFDEGVAFVKEIRRQAPKVKPVLLKAGETYRFDKKAGGGRRPAGKR